MTAASAAAEEPLAGGTSFARAAAPRRANPRLAAGLSRAKVSRHARDCFYTSYDCAVKERSARPARSNVNPMRPATKLPNHAAPPPTGL
ncbi:hypothetical protein GSH04_17540 [Burkholderia pseudomallei]|nr:hypothetical protein BHT10_25725 [Burkholderia pseudomallei]MBM5618134.1 hypothetical protein [Burkholderia pseudomallei]MBM5632284.1 hypothetical protein [Burkholderia pseudomallei]MBM5660004.1 hypothetical protein [Burkholderia pseudomallei]MBM5693487.1 hypothetical protein [Burkholderia pseudomallei]